MRRSLLFAAVLLPSLVLQAQTTPAPSPTPAPAPVQVMVLGSLHFANHNRDVANIQVDDMLAPGRQKELQQLAAELEKFKPTKVVVEVSSAPPEYVWKSTLDAADLKTNPDEIYQIGERVALDLNLGKVYGVDTAQDLDFDAVQALDIKMTGGKHMEALMEQVQSDAAGIQQLERTHPIGETLAAINTSASLKNANQPYMQMLQIAQGAAQPAAKLNVQWYERNVHIFSNLLQVAKPGDRVLVIFGQGHAFWLRFLVEQMPGYELVDPRQYLQHGR